MRISNLVSAYVQSLAARDDEAGQLQAKIARLEASYARTNSERLATRLRIAKHELNQLDNKHRAAACWVSTVARPLFEILKKALGKGYAGSINGVGGATVRICFDYANPDVLSRGVRRLCVYLTPKVSCESLSGNFDLTIQRALITFDRVAEPVFDTVPIDLPIKSLVSA